MRREARAWAGRVIAAVAIAAIGVVVVNGQHQQKDVYSGAHFQLELSGQTTTGLFKSVSGLSVETEVIDYQEGGNTGPIRKLAGATRYANIRLTRAFTGDPTLFKWLAAIQKPNPIRVDGRITMFDRHGTKIATWTFTNGFPVKWEGPDFDASKNEVAIETIEIAHEGLSFSDDDEPPPPPK